jgi:hypothetical protein
VVVELEITAQPERMVALVVEVTLVDLPVELELLDKEATVELVPEHSQAMLVVEVEVLPLLVVPQLEELLALVDPVLQLILHGDLPHLRARTFLEHTGLLVVVELMVVMVEA